MELEHMSNSATECVWFNLMSRITMEDVDQPRLIYPIQKEAAALVRTRDLSHASFAIIARQSNRISHKQSLLGPLTTES